MAELLDRPLVPTAISLEEGIRNYAPVLNSMGRLTQNSVAPLSSPITKTDSEWSFRRQEDANIIVTVSKECLFSCFPAYLIVQPARNKKTLLEVSSEDSAVMSSQRKRRLRPACSLAAVLPYGELKRRIDPPEICIIAVLMPCRRVTDLSWTN